MEPLYRHRQPGTLVLWALGVPCVALLAFVPRHPLALLGAAFFAGLAALFGTLTVEVDERRIRLWFGPGLIRRTIAMEDVVGAGPVVNRWWYGWGIRWTPKGWLWNVSGLDAVEITYRSGRRFRIGTDKPEALAAAIRVAGGME